MIKNEILNLDEIISEYSFYFESSKSDKYFCNCGKQFISKNEEEVTELEKVLINNSNDIIDDELKDVYKNIKLSLDKKIECPHCKKNYNDPEVKRKLILIGNYFISGYDFKETKEEIILYYSKACPVIDVRKKEKEKEHKIAFNESIKFITFKKESRKLIYQDFGDVKEIEFDLDEVIKYVTKFFLSDTNKIVNFYKLHMYINRIANFVSDTKNSNIVDDFLGYIRNTPNKVGIPYIMKLLSIFYGIIKYSNLSTISLTKNSQFLYDLMLECDIPSAKEMIKSKATSPVKIFNYLVTKYINKLNEEVNEDNREVHDFAYKSKQRIKYEEGSEKNKEEKDLDYNVIKDNIEAKYMIRTNKDYKDGKVVRADGKFQVLDAVEDGTISKFIYNHIVSFSQYKQIIKYFKFYDKKRVIAMLQKHDLDLLTHAIDIIYFRSKMEPNELDRVLYIMDTFVSSRFLFKDYKNLKDFSFVEYDDARMMMEIMGFDPKRHFNKIKNYDDLVKYHDELISYYKVKSEIEKSGAIEDFISKFKFLESKGENDYEGPLVIELHNSPGRIIKEGIDMRHSASEYAPNVAQGNYVLGSIYDKDVNRPENEMERFTIGFKYDKLNGLEFDQVKGFGNQLGSNRFKNLVMEFLTDKDISYRPIKDLKIRVEENESKI